MSTQNTSLALSDKIAGQVAELDAFARDNSLVSMYDKDQFAAAFMVAEAVSLLRQKIGSDLMKPIMALQNTSLGFRTDNKGGYPEDVVKEVFIEATMKGLKMVGNQVNIIAGRFYCTKEGFEYLLKNMPGLANLKLMPSVPKVTSDGAIVTYSATWEFRGKKDEIRDLQIPVRLNAGMGADGALGKAKRKMLAAIHAQITGTDFGDGDLDDEPLHRAKQAEVVHENPAEEVLSKETLQELEMAIFGKEEEATAFLIHIGKIREGQTWADVSPAMAKSILAKQDSFLKEAMKHAKEAKAK